MPKNLFWALCLSIALHLSLLGIQAVPNRPMGVRSQNPGALALNATLHHAEPHGIVEQNVSGFEDGVEGDTKPQESGNPESSLPTPKSVETSISKELWGLLLPKPEPNQDKPAYITKPEVVTYLRRSELTIPPVLQSEPLIAEPEATEKQKPKNGRVALRLFVSANGVVDRVEIVNSNLSPAHEDAVSAAFLPVKFRPGELQGVAVASQVVFEIDYDSLARGTSHASDGLRWWGSKGKPSEK